MVFQKYEQRDFLLLPFAKLASILDYANRYVGYRLDYMTPAAAPAPAI